MSQKELAIEEMRLISQKIFSIFQSQYIKKNIFDLIDDLTLEQLSGKFYQFINNEINCKKIINPEKIIIELKCQLKSFISYQLGSAIINHGIGCGYYDMEGNEDKKTIQLEVNKYLFNTCFNPQIKQNNYEHFISYLLVNFIMLPKGFSIEKFTKVFTIDYLKQYWQEHGDSIKKLNLDDINKVVINGQFIPYKQYMNNIYTHLDKI